MNNFILQYKLPIPKKGIYFEGQTNKNLQKVLHSDLLTKNTPARRVWLTDGELLSEITGNLPIFFPSTLRRVQYLDGDNFTQITLLSSNKWEIIYDGDLETFTQADYIQTLKHFFNLPRRL